MQLNSIALQMMNLKLREGKHFAGAQDPSGTKSEGSRTQTHGLCWQVQPYTFLPARSSSPRTPRLTNEVDPSAYGLSCNKGHTREGIECYMLEEIQLFKISKCQ